MRTIAALAVIAALTVAAPAQASRSRPGCFQAHRAAQITMSMYANMLDGRLIVGPCRKAGVYSMVTRIRIAGPVPQRFRIIITDSGTSFQVRARPLR